jgi:hypothetical protein
MNWIGALKLVPWGEVAKNAPAVVNGARKLMSRAASRSAASANAHNAEDAARPPSQQDTLDGVQARITSLEASNLELRNEMSASAQLITELAEQNANLIGAVELLRKRVGILLGVVVVVALGVIAVASFIR